MGAQIKVIAGTESYLFTCSLVTVTKMTHLRILHTIRKQVNNLISNVKMSKIQKCAVIIYLFIKGIFV